MDTLEAVKTLIDLVSHFTDARPRTGEPAARVATVNLVVSVMHHAAFQLETVTVENTDGGFKLSFGDTAAEVKPAGEAILFTFFDFPYTKKGRSIVPFMERAQEVPVSALSFSQAVKLAHAMLAKLVQMIHAAHEP